MIIAEFCRNCGRPSGLLKFAFAGLCVECHALPSITARYSIRTGEPLSHGTHQRVNAFSENGKVVSAMLQEWDEEAQQWQDIRPLRVKEDGTIVYSESPEMLIVPPPVDTDQVVACITYKGVVELKESK